MKPGLAPAAKLLGVWLLALPWLYPFATGPSPAVRPWLFALACATLLWLGRSCLSPTLILRGWQLAAGASAVIGLLQYAGAAQGLAPWIVSAGPGEAFGNLRQRNQFATLMNMGLAAVLWLALLGDRCLPRRLALLVVTAFLLGAANAASSSRTGMVQLLLLAALAGWWGLWRQAPARWLLLAALLAYGVASWALPMLLGPGAAGPGIWARLGQDDAACGGRLTLWRNVLQLIAARPWTGWGWAELDYAHFMTAYPDRRFCDLLDNAHNLPLHLAVELGLPAALLAGAAACWLLWRARPWRETDGARQAAWAVLGLILLHSLLEYPLWYGPFQLAVGLCLYLLWPRRASPVPPAQASPQGRPGWQRALAGTVLVLIAYAEWDYRRVSQIYLPPAQRAAAYREHTLEQIRGSWLFRAQVRFAEFSLTELTPENAARLNAQAHELLHYSPEARVVERLIESAVLLGRDEEARQFDARYRAAYPQQHARWAAARAQRPPQP